MLPILQFVFSSFWTWLGFAVLLAIAVQGVGQILVVIASMFGKRS